MLLSLEWSDRFGLPTKSAFNSAYSNGVVEASQHVGNTVLLFKVLRKENALHGRLRHSCTYK